MSKFKITLAILLTALIAKTAAAADFHDAPSASGHDPSHHRSGRTGPFPG